MTTSAFLKLSGNIRIGEILVQAGMLTKAQLLEATRHAGTKRLQIGQILVMYGYLTAKDLQAALAAQSMIRDRSIDLNQAIKYLKIAYKTGSRFEDVISGQEFANAIRLPTGKLGELLVDAGVITAEHFLKAMDKSLMTGLPLGRTLVLENVLPDSLLREALDVQVRLRDEMFTREEAIEAIQMAAGKPVADDAKERLTRPVPTRHGVRLGELMVMAGVLKDTDVMDSLEWALVNQQPIGKVLVANGLASSQLIDTALKLQKMVADHNLSAKQAGECLSRVSASGGMLDDVVKRVKAQPAAAKPSLEYQKLLILARAVTHDDISSAVDTALRNPKVMGKLLVSTGFLEQASMEATLQCHKMLREGVLNQDDAVVALDYCLHHRHEHNFEHALKELGWAPSDKGAKVAAEVQKAQPADVLPLVADDGKVEEPVEQPQPKARKGKHTDTIAPEDPRARELAVLINTKIKGGGILENTAIGELNPVVFDAYGRLAESYSEEGNYAEAQVVYERLLVMRLQKLGPNHVKLVPDLRNLAAVLCAQERFERAEPFLRKAVTILESSSDQEPLMLADALSFLANIYLRQDKFSECEPLLKRALEIRQTHQEAEHMDIADTLFDYARLLRKTGRAEEAEQMYVRAKAIMAKNQTYAVD